jgi:hypothetical protein
MGNKSKDANRERLEIMKAWALLVFAGITSLLIANELAYSAKDVLSEMYVNIEGVFSSNQYEILSSGFTTLGIVCIVVAIGLFLSIEKQSQNHTN